MDFRRRTIEAFAVVFDGETEETDEQDTLGRNDDEEFTDRWGWIGVMYRLTKGDITNLHTIIEMNLYECLTWLCYETDLEEVTKEQQKRNKNERNF